MPVKYLPKNIRLIFLSIGLLVIFQSCYSVRLINTNGVAEPDPTNMTEGFYRNKQVHIIDTVITLKPVQAEFSLLEKCSQGGFYSVEYRATFGGVLLSAVTFGKKRKVKVTYVCLKEE